MSIRTSTFRSLLVGAATAWALGMAPAQADTVKSQVFRDAPNQFDDDMAQRLQSDQNGNGYIDAGDTLAGIFEINKVFDLTTFANNDIGASGVNELSGFIHIEAASKQFVNAGLDGVAGTGDDIYDYTFQPYAGFSGGPDFTAGTSDDLPALTGGMIALYEDMTPDFTLASLSSATDGALAGILGFGSDTDSQWTGRLSQSLSSAGSASGAAIGAGFNFQLQVLQNNLGFEMVDNAVDAGCGTPGNPCLSDAADDNLIAVNGSGTFETTPAGGDFADGAIGDTQFTAFVPEPGTLALLGGGLIGVAATNARRRGRRNA